MNRFALLALTLCAPLANALETSAVGSADQAVINSAIISNDSKVLALQAVIEDLTTKLNHVTTCSAANSFWNGTTCVSAAGGTTPLSSGIAGTGFTNIPLTGVNLLVMTAGIDYDDSDEDGMMGLIVFKKPDGNYTVNSYARNENTRWTQTLSSANGSKVCAHTSSDSWGNQYKTCVQIQGTNFRIELEDRVAPGVYFTLGTPST